MQETPNGPSERLWNRDYCLVMAVNLSLYFSFYLLTPLLPLYLSEHFGAGKDAIGLALSGYTVMALLMRPFCGYLVDSYPRRVVMLVSLAAYFALFGGYLVAGGLLLFCIVRTLHGAPFGAVTVANSTVAIDVLAPSRRQEGVGYYGLSNNVACAIAPTVGLTVYHYTGNFQLLFWIAFVVAGIGLAVSSRIRLRERQLIRQRQVLSLDRFFLLRGWAIAVNVLIFGICYGVLSNFLAIYGKETMGVTGGTGLYFAVLSAGLILSRLVGVRSLRDGHLRRNAGIGVALSTVGYTLFVACPDAAGYYGSALLIGLGNGHFWPAFQNMILQVARKDERGTANSTIFTAWDLGMGLGIVMGGFVAEHAGYVAAFTAVAAIHVVGAVFFFCTGRTKRTIFEQRI